MTGLVPVDPQSIAEVFSTSETHKKEIKCLAYKLDAGFCTRVNTLATYAEANRSTLKGVCSAIVPAKKIHPDAQLDPKALVCIFFLFLIFLFYFYFKKKKTF